MEGKLKVGDLLQFNIYGYIVEGEFIKEINNIITIKTTFDAIRDFISNEQDIHKDHFIKVL